MWATTRLLSTILSLNHFSFILCMYKTLHSDALNAIPLCTVDTGNKTTHPALVDELLCIQTNFFGEVLEQPEARRTNGLYFTHSEVDWTTPSLPSPPFPSLSSLPPPSLPSPPSPPLLSHLPSEQEGQQRTSEVQSLVAIVIPVVELPPPEGSLQQPVYHVPVGVGGGGGVTGSHVCSGKKI